MRVIAAAYNFKGLEHTSGSPIVFFKSHDPEYIWDDSENYIIIPKGVKKIWAEVEFAFSIGNAGKIEGVGVANDITADWGADCHYYFGKAMPSFCKISRPWTYRNPPYDAVMTMKINGKQYQEGTIRDMILKPVELVNLIYNRTGLSIGDIVLSGTPYHTATALKEGDTVEVEIEGIGKITSKVINERISHRG